MGTMIRLRKITARKLKALSLTRRESYDEIINRKVFNGKRL